MRIRRLLLRSFGCLTGEFHFSADRANLTLEPNERGKSTLAAAILTGLYGFPQGQRRSETRPITDADLYRPWLGEEYLVEMDLEVTGEVFTIRRDFAGRKEQVFEWRSGKDITSRFQTSKDSLDFAGKLTGLSREDFARTVFLRQTEMQQIRDARGITAALQRMATSQQGDVAAAEATGILSDSLRQYRGLKIRRGKIDSEISAIEEEIRSLQEKIESMEERRRTAEDRIRELETTTDQEEAIDSRLERLEFLIIAAGRAEDEKLLEEETREKEDLDLREKEFQELSRFASFPAERRGRLAELKARMETLSEVESRARVRQKEDVEEPLSSREARAREQEGLGRLSAEDLSRLAGLETDLAAAWKTKREVRRTLRAREKRIRSDGRDPDRLRSLAERFSSLTPEQRRFLLDYGASEAESRRILSESERESASVEEEFAILDARAGRSRTARFWTATAAAVLALTGVILWFVGPVGAAVAAFSLAGVLAAVRFAAFGGSRDDEDLEAMHAHRESYEVSRAEHSGTIDSLRTEMEEITSQVGLPDTDSTLEEFREAEAHAEEAGELAALGRGLAESRASLEESGSTIRELMEAADHQPRSQAVTPREAREFRESVSSHKALQREIEDFRKRSTSHQQELIKITKDREALHSEIAELLREAGMAPETDLTEAKARFEEASRNKERYELLKKEVIPDLVRRSMAHRGDALRRTVEATGTILQRKQAENPKLAGLKPEKLHKEYIEERDRLRQESKSVAERRVELSHELSEILREYRRDYPDTQRWLREWERQRDRAAAFRSAVTLAKEVLEVLSEEAYAEWADVLNERASEALAFLAPGYEDLRFDESLTFSVRESLGRERRSQDDVDHRFSAGTRDQIYLAARLAMAGYLSSGNIRLPLVLDDPFATFDDDRFARAMTMLLEKFSRRHQLILLSCHEARHRAWQDRHPELFSDRVRIMTLQALTT
jgi:DNA repair exonuclease SbcCD ATPase subunit